MSRDWTPRETYLVEQVGIREGRGDYWDFLAGLEWVPVGRAPVRLHSDEEIALRKGFPVLGKFFERFLELHERLLKYENGIEFLKQQDLALQEYIVTGNHNSSSYLVRWFEGELDAHFYYRERNDTLLMECVCEEAMLHAGKQYDAYMMYRADWMRANGLSVRWDGAKLHNEYLEDVKEGRFEGTFHQYEMEFGYESVGTYDSFDTFLEKEWLEILERHQSFREGDFIDVIVDSHCQGLAKVLCITENGLFLEMIDGHYSMIPPNAKLLNNPFEADYNVILELRVVDPKHYDFKTYHETVSELISDAKTRSESFAGNEMDKIVDFEKE